MWIRVELDCADYHPDGQHPVSTGLDRHMRNVGMINRQTGSDWGALSPDENLYTRRWPLGTYRRVRETGWWRVTRTLSTDARVRDGDLGWPVPVRTILLLRSFPMGLITRSNQDIRQWDVFYRLRGHTDTITVLALSSNGSYVLSNMRRIWDVRPYASMERCVKVQTGHRHNIEKKMLRRALSPDGWSSPDLSNALFTSGTRNPAESC